MATSRINGIRIYWERAGDDGEPLVLVHGSWGDHQTWAPVVSPLSGTFRVLTYDRRGHSRSDRPPGQGSVREDVEDLAALLDELDHAPAHVVGSSFGGAIVLRLAVARPDLFRSLMVHEPPLVGLLEGETETREALAAVRARIASVVAVLSAGDHAAGARQFVETVAFGPGGWDELPQETRDIFIGNAPTWLDEMNDPETLELDLGGLAGFRAPALVTMGERSPTFYAPIVERVAAALPHAEVHEYPGAGHVPHLTHTQDYVQRVSDFNLGTGGAT